jgi:hypothetical protein
MSPLDNHDNDQRQYHYHASDNPDRTEFEVLKRDVQWLKYGVCVSAGSGVLTAALQLGAAPMPSAVAGVVTALAGLLR